MCLDSSLTHSPHKSLHFLDTIHSLQLRMQQTFAIDIYMYECSAWTRLHKNGDDTRSEEGLYSNSFWSIVCAYAVVLISAKSILNY